MAELDSTNWEKALAEACFPVKLTDVFVGGDSLHHAERYRAVVPSELGSDPFAIVTDSYKLIRNEDLIELGHEAFEQLFGLGRGLNMEVFNVVMTKDRGSFFADFTTPDLDCSIPLPQSVERDGDQGRHTFFLRIVNSYNKTRAVRLEVGICRWICRNGLIFGEQSIQFRNPHSKTKQQLMDQIARCAERVDTDTMQSQIANAYGIQLNSDMTVLEGVWQTLRLAIPPVNAESRTARLWTARCRALRTMSQEYERKFGKTGFSVLQTASQWGQNEARTSPIQFHNYGQRCGEMLELLVAKRRWPGRRADGKEQVGRIHDWSEL